MSIPTKSEEFAKLIEHLRKAQEASAMLAHLNNADGDKMGALIARGWLGVEEMLKMTVHNVTQLATKGLQ
jgi:aromatic ring-cleaving dioxygenase